MIESCCNDFFIGRMELMENEKHDGAA